MDDLRDLERIALMRYASLIQSSYLVENKLRFILYDGSILDIFHSFEKPLHWAFHWDRRQLRWNGFIVTIIFLTKFGKNKVLLVGIFMKNLKKM